MPDHGFDLKSTYVHLGLGSRVVPLPGFEWSEDYLAKYGAETAADGPEGRLVMIGDSDASWTSWERHPAGEELVLVLSGRLTLIQDRGGSERRTELSACKAAVNPAGVWHTVDVQEQGQVLFITPGIGTERKPR